MSQPRPVRSPAPPRRSRSPLASSDDEPWNEIETLALRMRDLSATLALVLGDHAQREEELELDLTEALGVAWAIRHVSDAMHAVVEQRGQGAHRSRLELTRATSYPPVYGEPSP